MIDEMHETLDPSPSPAKNEFSLTISLDNDAFHGVNAGEEIARILTEISERVKLFSFQHEKSFYPLRDINGNTCGRYGYTTEKK